MEEIRNKYLSSYYVIKNKPNLYEKILKQIII